MDVKMKSKNIQKYAGNHNQEYDEKDIQMGIGFEGQE